MQNTSDNRQPTATGDAVADMLSRYVHTASEQAVVDYYERALMHESASPEKAHVRIETPQGEFVSRHEFDSNQEAADLLTSLQGKPYNVTYKPIGMDTTGVFLNGKSAEENDTVLNIVLDNF